MIIAKITINYNLNIPFCQISNVISEKVLFLINCQEWSKLIFTFYNYSLKGDS